MVPAVAVQAVREVAAAWVAVALAGETGVVDEEEEEEE